MKKYEVIMSGSSDKSLAAAYLNIFYIVRRIIMISSIILLQDWPFFQIQIQFILSMLNLCYIVNILPYLSKVQNKIEILAETMVYNSIMMCLLYEI